MRSSLSILLPLLLILRAPAFAEEIKIITNVPDCDVYEVKTTEGSSATAGTEDEVRTHLGKTPFTLSNFTNSEMTVYKIEKRGYAPVYLPLLARSRGLTLIRLSLKKTADWVSEEAHKKSLEVAENMVDDLYAVQSMLDARKSKEALGLAESLHAKHPESIAARLVYANALLLNGDLVRARGIYAAALEEIPESRRTLRSTLTQVVARLSGRKPGRLPASQSPRKEKP